MKSIGVREWRQHASRYLARVRAGESLQITDRGLPVALISPVPRDDWQALVEGGAVLPPTEPGRPWEDEPHDYGIDASAELMRLRDAER